MLSVRREGHADTESDAHAYTHTEADDAYAEADDAHAEADDADAEADDAHAEADDAYAEPDAHCRCFDDN